MLTAEEMKCLALTLAFLAAGSGFKFWQRHHTVVGPFAATQAAEAPRDSRAASNLDATPDSVRAPGIAGEGLMDSSAALEGSTAREPAAADRKTLAPLAAGAGLFGGPDPGPEPGKPKRSSRARTPARKTPAGKVDINRSDAARLATVPGIGPKTADAIVEYRRAHGDFQAVQDLSNVKGIGEKKLERMRDFLVISPR